MSILIKGMKRPPNCFLCPLSVLNGERLFCEVTKDEVVRSKIPSDCPLVELPAQHGRLIDADVLNDMINRSYPMTDRVDVHNGYAICQEMIKQLPTVIEAEEK